MFRQKYFLLLLSLFIFTGPFVLAADSEGSSSGASTSEFYHQADSGKFELTPMLSYMSITVNYKKIAGSNLESATVSGFLPSVKGEYGFNSNYSIPDPKIDARQLFREKI